MAKKKETEHLTPLELEIMTVLWDCGPSTVQAVQQRLEARRPLAYTTVQTMLNVLHRKAKVSRLLEDRAYVYSAAVSRAQAARHAMGDIIDRMFGGSVESLVVSLVESRHVTPEKLAELTRRIEQKEATGDGNN
jgi:predicted transcriptional regulator